MRLRDEWFVSVRRIHESKLTFIRIVILCSVSPVHLDSIDHSHDTRDRCTVESAIQFPQGPVMLLTRNQAQKHPTKPICYAHSCEVALSLGVGDRG
jgi:hypothetical protein